MDGVQAAILLARAEAIDFEIEQRERLTALYGQRLEALAPAVRAPKVVPRPYDSRGVWYVYVVECDRRDALATFLLERGVVTETYYPAPLHLQPAFAALGHRPGDFPVAEQVCSRTLALPLFPDLEEWQVNYACDVIAEFYGG
jgi:dTDP-4-amino-4,6-dideoxygalactose transaminase